MRLIDVRPDREAGQRYTSLTFTPDPALFLFNDQGIPFANITISNGQLQTQTGSSLGSGADVAPDAELKILLSSSNTNGASAVSVVRQNGVVIGYYALITKNIATFSYDERYDDLFSAEVIPDLVWVPTPPRFLKSFDFNGVQTNSYDLNAAATNAFALNAFTVLDFNRDQTLVFDTDSKTIAKTLSGAGPISSSNLYGSDQIRLCTAIAYNKDNSIVIYDAFFSPILSLELADVAGVLFNDNKLYAYAQGSTELRVWTVDASLNFVAQPNISFAGRIHSLAAKDTNIYVMSEHELVDINDVALAALDADARNSYINGDTLYITHGFNTFITKVNLLDFSTQKLNIPDALFLDVVTVQSSGRIYVSDVEAKKVFVRDEFNQDWSVGFGAYGIALADEIYLFDAYANIPNKIDMDQLVYTLDSSDFVDITDFPLGDTGLTGAIDILTANKPVRVQLFPAEAHFTLMVNGIPQPNVVSVVSGDSIQVRFDYIAGVPDPLFFGVVIDQEIFTASVYLDDSRIVPFDFKFNPVYGAAPESFVVSNTITVSHLTAPVEVTTDTGIFVYNGNFAGNTVTIQNGDTLAVRVQADALGCAVVTARVTIEQERFETPFSVSTLSEPDVAVLPRPVLEFDSTYDNPLGTFVYSNEIDLSGTNYEPTVFKIPDQYEAQFVVNGIEAGQTITARTGDKIKIKVKTSYNYDTPHNVAISTCYAVGGFVAYTIGDTTPDAFNFGTIVGVSIKDFLSSNIVSITGIGNSVNVPVVIPYGTELYHNGQRVNLGSAPLDWRGVPLNDVFVSISMNDGDTLQLKGYGRPVHGDTVNLSVYVGGRRGFWTINTFDRNLSVVLDPELYFVPSGIAIATDTTDDYIRTQSYSVKVNHSNGTKAVKVLKPIKVSNSPIVVPPHTIVPEPNRSLVLADQQSIVPQKNKNFAEVERDPNYLVTKQNFVTPSNFNYVFGNSADLVSMQGLRINVGYANNVLAIPMLTEIVTPNNSVHLLDVDRNITVDNSAHLVNLKANIAVVYSNATYVVNVLDTNNVQAVVFSGYDNPIILTEFTVVRYDNRPFTLFDMANGQVIQHGYSPVYTPNYVWKSDTAYWINRDDWFDDNQNRNFITAERSWAVSASHTEVKTNTNFWIVKQPDPVRFVSDYSVNDSNVVYTSTKYSVSDLGSAYTFTTNYAVPMVSDKISFAPKYSATLSGANPKFGLASLVGDPSNRVVIQDPFGAVVHKTNSPLVIREVAYTHTDRNFVFAVAAAEPTEYTSTYVRSPQANELHPGYFATQELAEANALTYDYIAGQFYAVYIEEKGWAWTAIMPCENLCNPDDCPPRGYIHGG